MSFVTADFFYMKMCSDKSYQGGGVAAPVASQVLGEVLPYLDISKTNIEGENEINKVVVPSIEGFSISEARKILEEQKLNIDLSSDSGDINEDDIIMEQIPISGVEVMEGTSVIAKCNSVNK